MSKRLLNFDHEVNVTPVKDVLFNLVMMLTSTFGREFAARIKDGYLEVISRTEGDVDSGYTFDGVDLFATVTKSSRMQTELYIKLDKAVPKEITGKAKSFNINLYELNDLLVN